MSAAIPRGKVAITGSSGILGQRLYASLQANGWEVVGFGLADDIDISQGGPGRDSAEETRNDLVDVACDLAVACPSLEGFTHVVHLAGEESPEASLDHVLRSNVVATKNVLDAARYSMTVRRVVLASTNHVQTGETMSEEMPGTLALGDRQFDGRRLISVTDPWTRIRSMLRRRSKSRP